MSEYVLLALDEDVNSAVVFISSVMTGDKSLIKSASD